MTNIKKITKKLKKYLLGEVMSNKMDKTVVVRVVLKKAHPLYGKIMKKYKSYKAHTITDLKIGDKVKLVQIRPLSKDIQWRVCEVVKKD